MPSNNADRYLAPDIAQAAIRLRTASGLLT